MIKKIMDEPVFLAIAMVIMGFFLHSFADALLKLFISKYHISQVLFANASVVLILTFLHGFRKHRKGLFKSNHYMLYFIYSSLGMAGFGVTMVAIENIRLDEFYTIVFTAPLWVTLLSTIFFKEKIAAQPLIAILMGFLVILFVMRPDGGMFNIGAFAALASAIIFAIKALLMKKLKHEENSRYLFVMFPSLLGIIIVQPYLYDNWIASDGIDTSLFIICGVLTVIGSLFIVSGFQKSPEAYIVAPFHYTQLIWGTILGFVIFNDIPSNEVMLGAFALILIGLYLIYYQVQQSKKIPSLNSSSAMMGPKFTIQEVK